MIVWGVVVVVIMVTEDAHQPLPKSPWLGVKQKKGFLCRISCGICTSSSQQIFFASIQNCLTRLVFLVQPL